MARLELNQSKFEAEAAEQVLDKELDHCTIIYNSMILLKMHKIILKPNIRYIFGQ